METLQTMSVS